MRYVFFSSLHAKFKIEKRFEAEKINFFNLFNKDWDPFQMSINANCFLIFNLKFHGYTTYKHTCNTHNSIIPLTHNLLFNHKKGLAFGAIIYTKIKQQQQQPYNSYRSYVWFRFGKWYGSSRLQMHIYLFYFKISNERMFHSHFSSLNQICDFS